jgi:sulfofructose kinase
VKRVKQVKHRIVSLGIITLDRIWQTDVIPAGAVKFTASDFRDSGGGMAATAAVAIAALGGAPELWTRVGADDTGERLRRELAAKGVGISGVRVVPGAVTPCSAVIVDAAGERLLAVFRGRGFDWEAGWLPFDRLDGAAAVMADVRWAEGAAALFDAAGQRGIPRILDGDIGDPASLASLAVRADHVVFSAGGLAQFAGSGGADGLRRATQKLGGIAGVTLGAEGFMWIEKGALHHAAGFRINARDTTGAGDTFHGAYALAIARGWSVAEAARFANAAAALKCAKGDGWSGMPSEREVQEMIAQRS